MDAVRPQVLAAARDGIRGTGADGAAARAASDRHFADLVAAITAAMAKGVGLKTADAQ